MTLRRQDGRVYLDRWGIGHKRVGAIFLHRMGAADPGLDLHDHPWTFVSIVLAGGYTEQRADTRDASRLATTAERFERHSEHTRTGMREIGAEIDRGRTERRRRLSIRRLRLDECHRITELDGARCWTLVMCGPVRRRWGFYMPGGFLDEHTYDRTVRAERRDLWNEVGS